MGVELFSSGKENSFPGQYHMQMISHPDFRPIYDKGAAFFLATGNQIEIPRLIIAEFQTMIFFSMPRILGIFHSCLPLSFFNS
jgi:hypothetical protein